MSELQAVASDHGLDQFVACLRGEAKASFDWVAVITVANDFMAVPHLHYRLSRSSIYTSLDEELREYLESFCAANNDRNTCLRWQVLEVAGALNMHDIVPMIIKGMAGVMHEAEFPKCRRILHDVDLLVDSGTSAAAVAAIERLGYHQIEQNPGPHAIGSFARPDGAGTIDLHIGLPQTRDSILMDSDIRCRRVLVRHGEARFWLPNLSLHGAINILHDMGHNLGLYSGLTDIAYLCELDELVSEAGERIDQDWFYQLSRNARFALAIELQSRMANELFGRHLFQPTSVSYLGPILHKRRLWKLRHRRFAEVETAVFRNAVAIRKMIRHRSLRERP